METKLCYDAHSIRDHCSMRNEFPERGWKLRHSIQLQESAGASMRNEFPERGWKPLAQVFIPCRARRMRNEFPERGWKPGLRRISDGFAVDRMRNEFPERGWKPFSALSLCDFGLV